MATRVEPFQAALAAWEPDVAGDAVDAESAFGLLELAEELLASSEAGTIEPTVWHRYLDWTRQSRFLQSLPDHDSRHRWAETTFAAIRVSDYTLERMLDQRLSAHPQRVLFQELGQPAEVGWTYERVARRLRAIAATFHAAEPSGPKVAILAENSVDSACCDLACLTYDVFVTPLNPHFGADVLTWIFDRLGINIAVTDSQELQQRLESMAAKTQQPFRLFLLDPEARLNRPTDAILAEACARLGREQIEQLLSARPRRGLSDVATTMFTSGSTGMPKGVNFTSYNLITKRFARAAALPKVGRDEVLLCYLPLYHTFGRYLEMMGLLFWGGTYVFVGNPSAETLLAGLPKVRPSGLIGIPRRWEQIYERCLDEFSQVADSAKHQEIFRSIVGERLRWGLSAAGYLDPIVFHFFQRHGVELCSGFGMTEATGGITMTPPGEYEDNTVGIPLPGVRTRLTDEGELHIAGPYVARYLDEPQTDDEGYWLATGDVFRTRPSGHLEIVDRIKDIYKNNKGQTIAPRQVEQKFAEVPGILRTFLVGDRREYNVLLIVPDQSDPVLQASVHQDFVQEYLHQIVHAANNGLAPYERVVNFALLDRDFELQRGELTPKGSFRRKVIEENFAAVIDQLYQRDFVELTLDGLRACVPRWFYRDLGILETDIVADAGGLRNRRSGRHLVLRRDGQTGAVRIGDLSYQVNGEVVDLGLLARQPRLWVGNPALISFYPCKEGWDLPLGVVSPQVSLPPRTDGYPPPAEATATTWIRNQTLVEVNKLCISALFAPADEALKAVRELAVDLDQADMRVANVIRRRLEALAWHPDLQVRCLAYQVLLLDEPERDYSKLLPTFLLSGLPFLTEESIKAIAHSDLGQRRLEALRKRLHTYRTQLPWPASPAIRERFDAVLTLLANFARYHPEYYVPVRAELVSWAMHVEDPELPRRAEEHFHRLAVWFEGHLAVTTPHNEPQHWAGKIIFQEDLSAEEIDVLEKALVGTTFLKESVMLAFHNAVFELSDVPQGGIWISRVLSLHKHRLYRVSINTIGGKHFDLLIIIRQDFNQEWVKQTNFWMIAIYGHAYGLPVLPRFGCCRPALGALSLAYVSDLTAWEKTREFAAVHAAEASEPAPNVWRNLFVRAMSAFFVGWHNSNRRIIPGTIDPRNVTVPEPDFRQGTLILSLAGWDPYDGPLSLIRPMIENFYLQTTHHYPWCRQVLQQSWIFDACVEAFGVDQTRPFLTELLDELETEKGLINAAELANSLRQYMHHLQAEYHRPLSLACAIDRFAEWQSANPQATRQAREQIVGQLHRLYRLDRFGEIARYDLYRHTYFAGSEANVQDAFDALLRAMFHQPDRRPMHMLELSDLQAALVDPHDRIVFTRLVFPHAQWQQPLDVLAVGERQRQHVVVSSHITDARGESYTVREPIVPAEIGRLYRLFLEAGYPMSVSTQDRHFVAVDDHEQIIGGVCYKLPEPAVAHLEGIVVATPLKRRGISSALLEDFCQRVTGMGVRMVKTNFFSRRFYSAHGFAVDPRWGGLVRQLES